MAIVLKPRNHGITWKIFIYLLVFVLIVVMAITFVQSYALEQSYENDRINRVEQLADMVLKQSGSREFENLLNNVAMHEDCCIHILDDQGENVWSAQRFRNCMVHRMSSQQIDEFLAEADASDDQIAIRKEENDVAIFGKVPDGKRPESLSHDNLNQEKLPDFPDYLPDLPVNNVNVESLAYVAHAQDANGNDRYVLIGTTITPLDSTVLVLRQQMVFVVIFLVVAAAVLAWIMARSVAKPIIDINESAKELTRHNYDVTFDTHGYREITELRDTLNEAAVELNKTEQLRRELMANISHDLRTPLTMIVGYGEVMRDLPGENTPENVQVIIDEANRLSRLVEDVLDLSKMEASADEMEIETVNLTQAVEDMVRRCARMTEKEGYRIVFSAGQDAWVEGDELRLSQVVYNLIGNALTNTGQDHLVRIEQLIEKDWVRINVSDSGQGIPADRLKDIWQRYYKVDKIHRRSRVGTGLGLSIVKSIVEKHGGRCGVESSEGEGSTFWFCLPMSK
ncbi:MAG: HAMP domain-containing histidine kinase [Oscillospiraceae bacterium]|nr:HAMP domain-containing histidine kinase [Oscillospiraceae bacterium]